MTDGSFSLIERLPTIEEHRAMFEALGWPPYAPQAAAITLRNSLFCIVALRGDQVVGIRRVIGDGGVFFSINDVAVLPELQGQGIGTQIMDRLIAWIKANAPYAPFVSLFSTPVAREIYKRYGFAERREELSGMWVVFGDVDNT